MTCPIKGCPAPELGTFKWQGDMTRSANDRLLVNALDAVHALARLVAIEDGNEAQESLTRGEFNDSVEAAYAEARRVLAAIRGGAK